MNFQTKQIFSPLKVIFVNSLTPAGQMIIMKMLAGKVFGDKQLIDFVFLVYSNEIAAAEILRLELINCSFPCYNDIIVSSDIPRISDANVFCVITNLSNPNKIDLKNPISEEDFNALYLMIKVASNFSYDGNENEIDNNISLQNAMIAKAPSRKSIIMTDGLAVIDIMKSLSKDIPSDQFFCATAIPDVAQTILANHLKVQYNDINDVLVWAANDNKLHVEVIKPVVRNDDVTDSLKCNWGIISKKLLTSSGRNHTQFSPSWLKKEFIEKVVSTTSKNPYGPISRASVFCNALKEVWAARTGEFEKKTYYNLGVISDGSLGTIKGYPYILPLVICGDCWTINNAFNEEIQLRNELKRINKEVKQQHEMLIPYCRKFLVENVINKDFVLPNEDGSTISSFN
ncbi:hypothetical protein ACJJTC_016179 [Scirpophaga incertulas]